MIPVAIGHGDGGEVRAPMGIAIIGGLITSTVLTLVVVPVIYRFMEAIVGLGGRLANFLAKTDTRADEHWEQDAQARPSHASVHPAGE